MARAWIKTYRGKRGTTYTVRWLDADGQSGSEDPVQTKREAKEILSRVQNDLRAGRGRIATDQAWADFRAEDERLAPNHMAPASAVKLKVVYDLLERHTATPHVERAKVRRLRNVSDVTATVLEEFAESRRAEGIEPETVRSNVATIRAGLQRAKRRGVIDEVPPAPRVRTVEKRREPLTLAEIRAILGQCRTDNEYAFVWLSLTLGRRRETTLSLRWDQVDLENGVVRIDADQTKGKRSATCYLDPHGLTTLRRMHDAAAKRVADGKAAPKVPWVFATRDGNRWGLNIRRSWLNLLTRAGITRSIRIHDLKVTFCSGLASSGTSAAVLQELAAHKSLDTTMRHYARVDEAAKAGAVRQLPWVQEQAAADAKATKAGGSA